MTELEREDATDRLGQLFQSHGFPITREHDGLVLNGTGVRARATVFWQPSRSALAQLDVCLEPWSGTVVCESIAGWGSTRAEAIGDAFEAFTRGVFHVLLRAFLDPCTDDPQVELAEMTIGDRVFELTQSTLLIRGPNDPAHVLAAKRFLGRLEEQTLDGDTHWVRFFYSQVGGEPLCLEVLLDNEPWPAMQAAMAAEALPRADDYLSLRLFAVLLSSALPCSRASAVIASRRP